MKDSDSSGTALRQEAAHTPGPWTLVGGSPPRIIKPGKHDICDLLGAASNEGVMADARLIAAAPVLLEALTDACAAMAVGMVVAYKTPGSNEALATIQTAFAIARGAIAKATAKP